MSATSPSTVQESSLSLPITLMRYLAPFLLGLVLWNCQIPEGMDPKGWQIMIIFFSTLLGVMVMPMPMSAVTFMGIAALGLTQTLTMKQALAGYAEPITWLIMLAFFISHGFIKTGLGLRMAYCFMRLLGKKTVTLGYGLTLTDVLLAPAMPSITARAGAVVSPIMKSIAEVYDSHPGDTAKRMGTFLTLVVFHANAISSGMFLTAMAGNPLVVKLAADQDIDITWGGWALGALLPSLLCLLVMPLILSRVAPPTIRETPKAVSLADEKLKALGALKRDEWIMGATFVGLLTLWVSGRYLGLSPALVAMVGVCILLLSGVLNWDEVKGNKGAWDTMIWFGAFVTMAHYLSAYGVVSYISQYVGLWFEGMPAAVSLVAICIIYYFAHYFFAATTAQISAMYASFLVILLATGVPPLGAALLLAYLSNICAVVTHYGNGPAPILYGTGYVPLKTWWKAGFVMSIVYLTIWLTVGTFWLSWLGYL
ncbi:DASS family sodium-coupled anion symporter [Endozoicomonas arenosclerae]|uniref:DASS family sodium-coupled anion symporter n=1 Tax=Endozoicomonas arenosclerae TaxID=1633495 RepID=UPI000A549430|nr:DASS family sodium-coupled anion symporter [Endozoicomonas arenosclerae]